MKTITFDAAHFLSVDTPQRPYARMHGHSFQVEAAIEGEPDPEKGWVADFADRLKVKYPGLRQVKVSRPSIGEACIYDLPEA